MVPSVVEDFHIMDGCRPTARWLTGAAMAAGKGCTCHFRMSVSRFSGLLGLRQGEIEKAVEAAS